MNHLECVRMIDDSVAAGIRQSCEGSDIQCCLSFLAGWVKRLLPETAKEIKILIEKKLKGGKINK